MAKGKSKTKKEGKTEEARPRVYFRAFGPSKHDTALKLTRLEKAASRERLGELSRAQDGSPVKIASPDTPPGKRDPKACYVFEATSKARAVRLSRYIERFGFRIAKDPVAAAKARAEAAEAKAEAKAKAAAEKKSSNP